LEPETDDRISESSEARESRSEAEESKVSFKWPEDFELEWPEDEDIQGLPAAAEIEEAVQCLAEDVSAAWRPEPRSDIRRQRDLFGLWRTRVVIGAGRLAEDFRAIAEATDPWRSFRVRPKQSGRVESWAETHQRLRDSMAERTLDADFRKIESATDPSRRFSARRPVWAKKSFDAWSRHSTPGERRKMWIRNQRARDEMARSQGSEGGLRDEEGRRLRNERTGVQTADLVASWTSRLTAAGGDRGSWGVEGGRRLGSERAEARTADLEAGWTSIVTVDLLSKDAE
jgi:hypothetical protein